MISMNYGEALSFTHSLGKFGIRPQLGRMLCVCGLLGNPQDYCGTVHVAGTNGKGSVCAFTESALRCAGYKTGLYTSPFVTDFTERIRVNGKNVPQEDYALAASRVREASEGSGTVLTEFEYITACAFLIFRQAGVERTVLETGLGGRFDATNVISAPLVSVITSVSLDHTGILGDTVEKIAFEKAGIIKTGRPVVLSCDNTDGVRKVIAHAAAENKAPLLLSPAPEKISVAMSGTRFSLSESSYRVALTGAHQANNAAAAVMALRLLGVSEADIRSGLEKAENPARFEVISADPTVILDGGHNPGCAAALAQALRTVLPGEKMTFIVGMMRDKDADSCLEIIAPLAHEIIAVAPAGPRAIPARELAERASVFCPRVSCAEIGRELSVRAFSNDRPTVICGSLYLAGEIRPLLLDCRNEKHGGFPLLREDKI